MIQRLFNLTFIPKIATDDVSQTQSQVTLGRGGGGGVIGQGSDIQLGKAGAKPKAPLGLQLDSPGIDSEVAKQATSLSQPETQIISNMSEVQNTFDNLKQDLKVEYQIEDAEEGKGGSKATQGLRRSARLTDQS